ncbi:MAG: TonB family protein [Bacteroidota bacterium]
MIRPLHHDERVYRTRILAALGVSLLLVLGLAWLPFAPSSPTYAWRATPGYEPLPVQIHEETPPPASEEGAPITLFDGPPDEQPATEPQEEATQAGEPQEAEPQAFVPIEVQRLTERKVVEFADVLPEVEGGLGAFYLNIAYPEAAQQAGIEGRLVLEFIVEPDGRPTDIRVFHSLHALCDSAAVRAVRRTRFIPGKQNGQAVPVRMRLPVRFTLLNNPADVDSVQTTSVQREPRRP